MYREATIAALATAPAPAGVAVVRISGSRCRSVLAASFRGTADPCKKPRAMISGAVISRSSQVIDRGLAVFMPGPHSYTGEDVAELHLHGSPLLVRSVLRTLYEQGVEPAEPGEFTKRAYLNGKLDLLQAEAVCGVITASNERALQAAQQQLAGRYSHVVAAIGEPLRDVLAQLEAGIDFPEEDIEPETLDGVQQAIHTARGAIRRAVESADYGRRLREGFRVLLWGRPNAGKSTILNLLLREERAIVTEIAGTTRDVIEERADIGGYGFVFCDCAGMQESSDKVEQLGVARAAARLAWADLVLFIVDASAPDDAWRELLPALQGARRVWAVINKIDLSPGRTMPESPAFSQLFRLCALSGEGSNELQAALVAEVEAEMSDSGDYDMIVTGERQRLCLARAEEALDRADTAIKNGEFAECVSAEIRLALSALAELIGATSTDEILDRIFSRFCIGK